MIPGAIFSFLVGAVLSWSFRVWILVPVTLVAMAVAMTAELALGGSLLAACGDGLVIWIAPQFGYGFGLFARSTLVVLRSPLAARSSRSASVAMLYKRRSIDQAH
jgi:hypothetical protein